MDATTMALTAIVSVNVESVKALLNICILCCRILFCDNSVRNYMS